MKLAPSTTLWLVLTAGSATLVAVSLALTAWLDLHPCHLCIFQRLLFMLVAALALVAALPAPSLVKWLAGGSVVGLGALGVGVAGYQSWLQVQPPDAVSCVGSQPGFIERVVEWLGQQAPAMFLATGFCEEEELVILGLSLANWAALSFAAVVLAAAAALFLGRRAEIRTRTRR
jgi:disulfide bond formation protein DsbB